LASHRDKAVDAVLGLTDCIVTGSQGVAQIDHKTYGDMMRNASLDG